jgi:homoaconitase/3-isopropylmalate dehydratase large subunit
MVHLMSPASAAAAAVAGTITAAEDLEELQGGTI